MREGPEGHRQVVAVFVSVRFTRRVRTLFEGSLTPTDFSTVRCATAPVQILEKTASPSGLTESSTPAGIISCCSTGKRKRPGAGQVISCATSAPRARIASAADKMIALGALPR